MATERARSGFQHELHVYPWLQENFSIWVPELLGISDVGEWRGLILADLGRQTLLPWSQRKVETILRELAHFHIDGKGTGHPTFLGSRKTWLLQERERWLDPRKMLLPVVQRTMKNCRPKSIERWFDDMASLFLDASCEITSENPDEQKQLIHGDLRSDNIRLIDGHLYLLDWARATTGPVEFDVAMFIQTVVLESGMEPEHLLSIYCDANPIKPQLVDSALVSITAFFANQGWKEEIPGFPRLRIFQRQQFAVSLRWLLERLNAKSPSWLTEFTRLSNHQMTLIKRVGRISD